MSTEKDCSPTQTENGTECGHSRGELFANQECEIDRRNIDTDRAVSDGAT